MKTVGRDTEASGSQGYSGYCGRKADYLIISPKYQRDGTDRICRETGERKTLNDINVKIEAFEDMMNGWFLNHAESLSKNEHAGFAVLSLCVEYIEAIQQYRKGEPSTNNSKQFFNEGINRMYGVRLDLIENCKLYGKVRCGLCHSCLTKEGVQVSSYQDPITINEQIIMINSKLFFDVIKRDFKDYIQELKHGIGPGSDQLRLNFETMFGKMPTIN